MIKWGINLIVPHSHNFTIMCIEHDIRNPAATRERIVSDRGDGIGYGDGSGSASASCQMGLGVVGIKKVSLLIAIHGQGAPRASACCAVVYNVSHTIERIDSDRGDGIGDGDAGEAAAIIDRTPSDRGDGIRNGDARQPAATVEHVRRDSLNAIPNCGRA